MKGVLIHGLLLLLAAGLAWQSWTREPDRGGAQEHFPVQVWAGRPAGVRAVVLRGAKREVRVERRGSGESSHLWVQVRRNKKGAEGPETVIRGFPGGAEAQKVLDDVAPLRARRSLGKLPQERLAAFGLAEPEQTLTVEWIAYRQPRAVQLGSRVYQGQDWYAADTQTSESFVIGGPMVERLLNAESRLMERRLHAFKGDEIVQVTARRLSDQAERQLRRGTKGARPVWSDAARPEETDPVASNWMRRVRGLRALEYPEVEPEGLEVFLRLEYQGVDGPLGSLELGRAAKPGAAGSDEAKPGEAKPGEATPDYFARSELSGRLVRVNSNAAGQIERDLALVFTPR